MGMMGKAVLLAVWVVAGHPPVVQQVEMRDIQSCISTRDAMDRDHANLPKGSPAFMGYCLHRER